MTSSDPLPSAPALRPACRTTLLRNAGHGANDLYWFILPPVLPLILQEFGLRYAAGGGLITAFLCVTALASMLMGRLSDSVDRTKLVGLGFLFATAALWAGALMPRLPYVISFIVLGGIGVSAYHPAAYASIHDSGHGQGRTYGAFEASGSLANIIMLGAQGLLVARVGWRGMIAAGALPGALMGLVFLLVPGAKLGGVPGKVAARVEPLSGATVPNRGMMLSAVFIIGVMLRGLGVNALYYFIPTYLVRAVHMDPGIASFAMGFAFLGGVAGAVVMGRAADRWGHIRTYVLASGLLIPLLPVMGARMPAAAYPAVMVAIGFASSACFPAQTMLLTELSGTRGKGSVFGVLMGATALTAAVSPLLFGLLADAAGLVTAVIACVIPVTAGWIVTLIVWKSLRSRAR